MFSIESIVIQENTGEGNGQNGQNEEGEGGEGGGGGSELETEDIVLTGPFVIDVSAHYERKRQAHIGRRRHRPRQREPELPQTFLDLHRAIAVRPAFPPPWPRRA